MTQSIPEDIYQPGIKNAGKKSILILTADKTEDLEFFYPYYRFVEEGYRVDVATPDGGEFKGKQGLGLKSTLKISDVSVSTYDLLYIPGGKAPEKLKKSEEALALVRAYATTKKPIAAVCHGPQVLAAADVVAGRTLAAWPEVESELKEAGANYVSQETVVDGQFITARWPADLPAHIAATLQALKASSASAATRAV